MKTNKGFPIYFDWIERLKDIEPDRAFAIICALSDYSKDGVNPLERFVGAERALVGIMFDQVKRAEYISAVNSENGLKSVQRRSTSVQRAFNERSTDEKIVNHPLNYNNNNSNNNNITEKEINKEKELPQKPKNDGKIDEKKPSVMEQRFNQFWAAYPKKVGKAYAEQCFKKLKPTAELTQKMLDAISEQKKSAEWTRDNGQFIPHPSTWLNQGRWDDEPITSQDGAADVVPKYSTFNAEQAMQAAIERSLHGI